MASDLVSIIMAAYNAEKWIQESIQSVLDQDYNQWELLVVDDGSTDNTAQIVSSFDDQRLRSFQIDHKGVSAARNVGLENMGGDFFCFLDADDRLPPHSLDSRIIKFVENPELEFVDGFVEVIDCETDKVISQWRPDFEGKPVNHLLQLDAGCFFGPTWMFKRLDDRNYQFKEELTHGEDLLFCITNAVNGGFYSYTDAIIYKYRKGNRSAMENLDGLARGYKIIGDELNKAGLSSKQVKKFQSTARTVMFKSYLGYGRPLKAIRYIF